MSSSQSPLSPVSVYGENCARSLAPPGHFRTHNTDLRNRLAAYAAQHPTECRQLDADPDTGGMEFSIRKGRLSFRLTAPYSEKRKQAAREAAKRNGFNRKP